MINGILKATAAVAVFKASGSATIIMDDNSIILMANDAACNVLGYSAEELEGNSVSRIIEPSQKHPHDKSMKPYINGKPMSSHDRVKLSNGRYITVHRKMVLTSSRTYLVGEIKQVN